MEESFGKLIIKTVDLHDKSDSGCGEELIDLSLDDKTREIFDLKSVDRGQLEKLLRSVYNKEGEAVKETGVVVSDVGDTVIKEDTPEVVRRQSVIIQGLVMETEELRDKVAMLEDELTSVPLVEELQSKLDMMENNLEDSESYVYKLLEENIDMKTEMEDLEQEIKEAQDHFRDNDAREFKKTKWELETMSKTVRNLQLKLKKAQLRAQLLRQEKEELEEKQTEGTMWKVAAVGSMAVIVAIWKLKN